MIKFFPMKPAMVLGALVAALIAAVTPPEIPWPPGDRDRPVPPKITADPGSPPSDAVVLFDGQSLAAWQHGDGKPPAWKVKDGYFEIAPGTGDLVTVQPFGDCQLHIEWATPSPPQGTDQEPGNSGVYLMSLYEIQVLDSFPEPDLRGRAGGGPVRAISSAGERQPRIGRVAELRHHLPRPALRRSQRIAALGHADATAQRRAGARPRPPHGPHGLHESPALPTAPGNDAAAAAGSRAARAVSQYLDPGVGRHRAVVDASDKGPAVATPTLRRSNVEGPI